MEKWLEWLAASPTPAAKSYLAIGMAKGVARHNGFCFPQNA